jgi:proton-dependent oligopeptide transporter, POT family
MRQRHPLGLYILFFTEMWERFGFYTMEAVFVFYMESSQYSFLRANASQIYGLYLGGVYFTPFIGGLLSEWRFGYSLSILLGGLFMAAGYGFLSLEPAVCFGVGLAGIIIGNGLFKPNISSLVGKLYPAGDKRIDTAFTIFYMGINVGALLGPIAASALVNIYAGDVATALVAPEGEPKIIDSHKSHAYLMTFAVAAAGMLLGEVIYFFGKRFVRPIATSGLLPNQAEPSSLDSKTDSKFQTRRNIALLIFFGINILFWMAFKQKGNTLAQWARDRTDLSAPSWLATLLAWLHIDWFMLKDGLMGKELFSALNPFYVIAFSPLLVWFWNGLRAMRIDVPTPAKLVLGFALTAGAFAIMWRVASATQVGDKVTPLALVACYAVLTIGELCLSPMGLSLVSKLAPSRTRAVWMGMFLVSTAIGGYLAGGVRQFIKDWPVADFFALLTGSSLFAMFLMSLSYPLIAAALRPPPDASA